MGKFEDMKTGNTGARYEIEKWGATWSNSEQLVPNEELAWACCLLFVTQALISASITGRE